MNIKRVNAMNMSTETSTTKKPVTGSGPIGPTASTGASTGSGKKPSTVSEVVGPAASTTTTTVSTTPERAVPGVKKRQKGPSGINEMEGTD